MLATILLATACGGGDGTPEPASLESCDAIAGAAITVIQDSIDILEAASVSGAEPPIETVEAVETAGAALEERAQILGCSDEEMSSLMADLAVDLKADSVFGQLIIESLKAGDEGFFGDG